jgi:hypothetical protein
VEEDELEWEGQCVRDKVRKNVVMRWKSASCEWRSSPYSLQYLQLSSKVQYEVHAGAATKMRTFDLECFTSPSSEQNQVTCSGPLPTLLQQGR